jgi:hypothetical protein
LFVPGIDDNGKGGDLLGHPPASMQGVHKGGGDAPLTSGHDKQNRPSTPQTGLAPGWLGGSVASQGWSIAT